MRTRERLIEILPTLNLGLLTGITMSPAVHGQLSVKMEALAQAMRDKDSPPQMRRFVVHLLARDKALRTRINIDGSFKEREVPPITLAYVPPQRS